MGRIRKLGVSAAVAAIAATAILMSPALPAQAAVCSTGGDYGKYGGFGWATCGGTGVSQTQVIVFCQDNNGAYSTVYGPWVRNSSSSYAQCSSNARVISIGYRNQ